MEIFNVRFDNITLEEAVDRAEDMVRSTSWHYVAGTNANLLRIARRDERYREVINQADLSLADGYGVICASRILGTPLTERIPCMDLLNLLLTKLEGIRVYLLGGRPGIAEKAGERLREQYPGLILCGLHHGFFEDSEAMAEEIARCAPELLLVCLGSPKQELWMAEHGAATGARLACGCGGWIDVCAGELRRAPESWRKRNLEWVYRFLQEPWRFGRVCLSLILPLLALMEAARRTLSGRMSKGDWQDGPEKEK